MLLGYLSHTSRLKISLATITSVFFFPWGKGSPPKVSKEIMQKSFRCEKSQESPKDGRFGPKFSDPRGHPVGGDFAPIFVGTLL